jgi:Sensors of blue-light using FAD
MLSHLVYVSSRTPKCTEAEIQKILASCKKNNSDIGITGVLLYSDSQFVQYMEGDFKSIIALYDKIKIDDRHKSPIMISSAPIAERTFPSWQMGSKTFDLAKVDYQTTISTEDKEVFKEILSGKSQEGNKALALMKQFFK